MSKNNIRLQKEDEMFEWLTTVMQGYSTNPQKAIEEVRNKVIECAKSNDFSKAEIMFYLLRGEYPEVNMKVFHFVRENGAKSDNSLYDIIAGSDFEDAGNFVARLSSFFKNNPKYLATPVVEPEAGPEDISKPEISVLLGDSGDSFDNNAE